MKSGDYAWNTHERECYENGQVSLPSPYKIKILDDGQKRLELEQILVQLPQKLLAQWTMEHATRFIKWTATEVRQLLDDLNEFEPKENEFYCLQPIIIKVDNDKKELIDGQQRCTTIYLILQYLGQDLFDINYQTRKQSAEFLTKIATLGISGEWNDWVASYSEKDNVDNYHFFQAYRTIQDWFAKKSEDKKSHFLRGCIKTRCLGTSSLV